VIKLIFLQLVNRVETDTKDINGSKFQHANAWKTHLCCVNI